MVVQSLVLKLPRQRGRVAVDLQSMHRSEGGLQGLLIVRYRSSNALSQHTVLYDRVQITDPFIRSR